MTKTEAIDKVRKLLALANSANENEATYRSSDPLSVSNADAYHAGQRAGATVQIGGGHALGPGARALKAGAA